MRCTLSVASCDGAGHGGRIVDSGGSDGEGVGIRPELAVESSVGAKIHSVLEKVMQ